MLKSTQSPRSRKATVPPLGRSYLRRTCPCCHSRAKHVMFTRDSRRCADCGALFNVPPTRRQIQRDIRELHRRLDECREVYAVRAAERKGGGQ